MTLLDDLKSKLKITWSEDDARLLDIIEQSKSYLLELTGGTFLFDQNDWIKKLLLNHCFYEYNNAGDEFEHNYDKQLKRLLLHVALESEVIPIGEIKENT